MLSPKSLSCFSNSISLTDVFSRQMQQGEWKRMDFISLSSLISLSGCCERAILVALGVTSFLTDSLLEKIDCKELRDVGSSQFFPYGVKS